MNEIIDKLKDKGCKIIIQDQFSLVAKCSDSYVVKSPSSTWNVHVPLEKLKTISEKLYKDDISPQKITVGKMIRNGSWSRMFDFHINNEVSYIIPQSTLEESTDKELKEIISEMNDQKVLLNEDINSFDIQKDFMNNIKKISSRSNTILTKGLKKSFQDFPVICHSKPIVQKYWTANDGEVISYKIKSDCVIPTIQKEIDGVLDSALERGKITQYTRYINSRMTQNKKFMLNGIDLYQKGAKTPFAKFSISNEKIFAESDFIDQIHAIEEKFADKNDSKSKDIDLSVFTKYIL